MVKDRQNFFFIARLECRPNAPRELRLGFTLVEILIVLLVVTTVMALAIPRLRVLTREQSLREGARILGSAIGKARDEAQLNGSGGIVLKRNPNFNSQGDWFASTEIGILRAVPDYIGDQIYIKGATPPRGAARIAPNIIDIPYPIEHEDNPPVSVGDLISVNHSATSFEITGVEPNLATGTPVLRLTVDVANTYPALPPQFDDVPFVVQRRPRLRRSSTQLLGGQRMIDLRFSGYDPVFEEVKDGNDEFINYDIEILFGKTGHTSKILFWELNQSNQRTGRLVTDRTSLPIYLLVTDRASSPLSKLAFWVTIKFQPSSPTIGYSEVLRNHDLLKSYRRQAREARGMANDEALH